MLDKIAKLLGKLSKEVLLVMVLILGAGAMWWVHSSVNEVTSKLEQIDDLSKQMDELEHRLTSLIDTVSDDRFNADTLLAIRLNAHIDICNNTMDLIRERLNSR